MSSGTCHNAINAPERQCEQFRWMLRSSLRGSFHRLLLVIPLVLGACASPEATNEVDPESARAEKREAEAVRAAAPEEQKGREAEASGDLRVALQHYVGALQAVEEEEKTNKEYELRMSIVRVARELDPPPVVTEEAGRLFDQAEVQAATANNGFGWEKASESYETALRLAPWVSSAYYNLALLKDAMGNRTDAISAFKLFLEANPDDGDAAPARLRLIELEQIESESGPGALEGEWDNDPPTDSMHARLIRVNKEVHVYYMIDKDTTTSLKGDKWGPYFRLRVNGRRITGTTIDEHEYQDIKGFISDDLNTITFDYDCGGGSLHGTGSWATLVLRRRR